MALSDLPPVHGRFGRLSPPPPGMMYVRDPAAARANAIRATTAAYQAAGVDVPEHLIELSQGIDPEPEEELLEIETDFPQGAHVAGRGQGGHDAQHAGHAPPGENGQGPSEPPEPEVREDNQSQEEAALEPEPDPQDSVQAPEPDQPPPPRPRRRRRTIAHDHADTNA